MADQKEEVSENNQIYSAKFFSGLGTSTFCEEQHTQRALQG